MTKRRTLAIYGPRGAKVRVLVHNPTTIRVQWSEGPRGAKRPRVKEFLATREGKATALAWAKGFALARTVPGTAKPVTLREMWTAYITAEAHLRARSAALYREQWRYWEIMWGRDYLASDTTLGMMDEFRAALSGRLGPNHLGSVIRSVKRVYRYARSRGLIATNAVAEYQYKIPRDAKPEKPSEYSPAEYAAIRGQLDLTDGRKWRAAVGLLICGLQGVRENAACHLAWDDIDFDAGEITWRRQWDKLGREWTQPLRPGTRVALEAARLHRERLGYTGPWVLFSGSTKAKGDGSYSRQSLINALRTIERAAGVAYIPRRGPHGLRRLIATDIAERTGNPILAMRAIGDTDVKMANIYVRKRDESVREAFRLLDQEENEQ